MNFSGFFFDLDGTLVDSLGDITGVLNLTRQGYSLPPLSQSEVKPHIGEGVEHLLAGVLPEVFARGATDAAMTDAVTRFRKIYLDNPHHGGVVYPGVQATLKRLREVPGAKLAIVTNKMTAVAEKTLLHYLPDCPFDCVVGPDRAPARKPSPLHLQEALKRLSVPVDQAIFVGDSRVDRLSAEGAGVKFFAAAYGFGDVEDQPGVDRLGEFSHLLQRLGLC